MSLPKISMKRISMFNPNINNPYLTKGKELIIIKYFSLRLKKVKAYFCLKFE